MICGHCKASGNGVDIAHVRRCGDSRRASIRREPPTSQKRQETPAVTKRYYINVPYREKEEAKREIGAKWDAKVRKWWVPEGTPVPDRWSNKLASEVEPPATGYYIAFDSKGQTRYYMVYKTVHGMSPGQTVSKVLHMTDLVNGVPTRGVWRYEAKRNNEMLSKHGVRLSLEEAGTFGQIYGFCIRCGRTLTDEQSKKAGIGPICATKWEH